MYFDRLADYTWVKVLSICMIFAKMNEMMYRMYRKYVQLNMSNIGVDHVDHVVCRWECMMRYMKISAVEQNIKGIDNMSI